MVALMRFTKDICRLLGLGNECPREPQPRVEMECGGPNSHLNEDVTLSQDVLSGEEGLSEEEKVRRRAERRRAKRKRRRERKKLEKVKKSEGGEQGGEDEEGEEEGAESELEDSESEEEDQDGRQQVEEEQRSPCAKDGLLPLLASSGNHGNHQPTPVSCEEEPEWDVSSAFVANAASHIRPKGRTKCGPRSKENKENETRTREVNGTESISKLSTSLTEKGIELVQQGEYAQAISMFTEAIKYNPHDYRFFGNRSYCYECLEQYPLALVDAERSIHLAPEWPKGYFRKGSALMGMKRYSEAEKAMELVLKLDKDCEEAVNELFNCRVLQLMELGFEETQSVLLLERYPTVQAVLASPEASKTVNPDSIEDPAGPPCCSLWVGNVTAELTDKRLWDIFKTFGEIDSIRVLHERFCAFVNFRNADMAALALENMHGVEIENTRLVIRYPDRRTQRVPAPLTLPQVSAAAKFRRRGPVHGDECYFWRTTGCHFGEKCRYQHIPEQCGRDRKPWQP